LTNIDPGGYPDIDNCQYVALAASKEHHVTDTTTPGVAPTADQVREEVRARYAAAATDPRCGNCGGDDCCDAGADGGCCDAGRCGGEADDGFGAALYTPDDTDGLPDAARLASLGCGNPIAVAELREGETVLDLGSGGGIDVLLSARRVGASGKAYGLDMTQEMLDLARRNAAEAGATNVEFLEGRIESIPLPDASVDVIISNCVINLSVDKPAVLAEMHRVLRPDGRIGISDVLAEDHLTSADRAERGTYVGCIAGALSDTEYRDGLTKVGFSAIAITPTHDVADGMRGAIVRAAKAR
jgi:SAM-dependent methyltransferase